MLLDASCKPLKVVIDECPKSIIVRALASQGADGRVRYQELDLPRRGDNKVVDIHPVVSVPRKDVTCIETRLPLHHIRPRPDKKAVRPPPPAPYRIGSDYEDLLDLSREAAAWGPVRNQREPIPIVASPFEVASFYKDSVSDYPGVWRLNISVEMVDSKLSKLWFVTVFDETNVRQLVTLTAKNLNASKDASEITPLQRFIRTAGRPLTAWDRILENSEDDDAEGI